MNALEFLFAKGYVEIPGLYAESLKDNLKEIMQFRQNILALSVFECLERDGFVRNTTTIYLTDRMASFRPTCKIARKRILIIRSKDKEQFNKLHPLAVLPMTKEEKADLDLILGRK